MALEQSDCESDDSVSYPSDDETSSYERRMLKLKRHRERNFRLKFNDGNELKLSNVVDVVTTDNYTDSQPIVLKRKRMSAPVIFSQPRKSLRTSQGRIDYQELSDLPRKRNSFAGKRKPRTPKIQLRKVEFDPNQPIGLVCYNSSKVYSSAGTTCHQCRQKTIDQKTVCFNPTCIGLRGQFCGYCLINRYGERVEDALRDKNWNCPPCRRICNCSFCRRNNGKLPTGQLYRIALSKGFSSVNDYLAELGDSQLDDKVAMTVTHEDVDFSNIQVKEEVIDEEGNDSMNGISEIDIGQIKIEPCSDDEGF